MRRKTLIALYKERITSCDGKGWELWYIICHVTLIKFLVQPIRFYRRGSSYLYTIHTKHTTQLYNRKHVRNSMKTWSTPSLIVCWTKKIRSGCNSS
jgi:hypothetical protein